jgi:hypothetical protein
MCTAATDHTSRVLSLQVFTPDVARQRLVRVIATQQGSGQPHMDQVGGDCGPRWLPCRFPRPAAPARPWHTCARRLPRPPFACRVPLLRGPQW